MLRIHLIAADGTLLDSATMGGAYTTGHFVPGVIFEGSRYSFRFIDNRAWVLHLLDAPQLRLPFTSEPKGVHRGLTLKRYFTVAAINQS